MSAYLDFFQRKKVALRLGEYSWLEKKDNCNCDLWCRTLIDTHVVVVVVVVDVVLNKNEKVTIEIHSKPD